MGGVTNVKTVIQVKRFQSNVNAKIIRELRGSAEVDQRGLVFIAQGDYSSAIQAYKKARGVCEDLMQSKPGDEDIENRFGQVVHHLGVAYVFLNEPERVDEAYESQITALNSRPCLFKSASSDSF